MPRPQFRLRSLFILTAIVAVGWWLMRTIRPQWKTIAATLPLILAQLAILIVGFIHHRQRRQLRL